ncbi:MAG: alpha/beta hydrolase [Deltaproteobacteria bacterium]|nr:alpha/beta hydrolase [Deltaproteobacteria bacterium]
MIPLSAWKARGRTVTTPAGAVFVVDTGAEHEGTPVLVLHGFPTASWDFAEVVDLLARRRRVVAFDFLGYGFSDKPARHAYSLFEQADVALTVARACGIARAHLLAHDMGTSVATELCARRAWSTLPIELASLVLMNGSVHLELAHLTIGQRLLRSRAGRLFAAVSSRRTFGPQIARLCARRPTDAELDAMWELVARDDGAARLPQIISYLDERERFRHRWIGALERLDVPTLVAWGERDPVAVLAIARALAGEIPGARLRTWPELGHWPQLEDPSRVARTVESFWDELPF